MILSKNLIKNAELKHPIGGVLVGSKNEKGEFKPDGNNAMVLSELGYFLREVLGRFDIDHEFKEYKFDPKINLNDKQRNFDELLESAAKNFSKLLKTMYADKVRQTLRTSIDASVLYEIRKVLGIFKMIPVDCWPASVLAVRETMEGFYATNGTNITPEGVHWSGKITKQRFFDTCEKSIEYAQKHFGNNNFKTVYFIKSHLFADGMGGNNHVHNWVSEFEKKTGAKIEIVAPELAPDWWDRVAKTDNQYVAIHENAVGNTIMPWVTRFYGRGGNRVSYSMNIPTKAGLDGLLIFQNSHGAARDADPNYFNPISTFRIAARMLENEGIEGIQQCLETILDKLRTNKYLIGDDYNLLSGVTREEISHYIVLNIFCDTVGKKRKKLK